MPSFYKESVDFNDINFFSSLIIDYLASSDSLGNFSSFPFNKNGFLKKIEQRNQLPHHRSLLKEVIIEQYNKVADSISQSVLVEKNISLLGNKNTFTVTTGHQLNLFTGPLYFIYKIISTINLAAVLCKEFPEYNFVPVYWMASEDHDLDEINYIHLFGKKIAWNPTATGAAGGISCKGITEIIEEVRSMFSNHPKADHLLQLFTKAYNEKNNLATATRIIVHTLFSQHGLVILDADDVRLKKLFIDVMKDDIVNKSAFRLVGETIHELEKKYKSQVHPREINLFYLGDFFRERIVEKDGAYIVMNRNLRFSENEMLQEIENHPEKFSPNVVLRPLYQEKILPNLAYIGGPAEIAYWLEYKKMFEHYGAELPILVLRSCMMILDASVRDKLKKLGLEPKDVFLNEEDLIRKYLKLNSTNEFSIESLLNKSDTLFNETVSVVNEIDPTLKASVEAEKQKMAKSLRSLEERIRRAEKKKYEIEINQVRKMKEKLFPENILQERYDNLLTYYSKYGDDFLEHLIIHGDPFEKKFMILIEE